MNSIIIAAIWFKTSYFCVRFESAFAKASDFAKASPDKSADKIGFVWVCFFGLRNHLFFCNPLLKLSLHSFWLFGNWVCIGFVLALIGFVLGLFLGVRGDEYFGNPLL